jgi:hypothetical protein
MTIFCKSFFFAELSAHYRSHPVLGLLWPLINRKILDVIQLPGACLETRPFVTSMTVCEKKAARQRHEPGVTVPVAFGATFGLCRLRFHPERLLSFATVQMIGPGLQAIYDSMSGQNRIDNAFFNDIFHQIRVGTVAFFLCNR